MWIITFGLRPGAYTGIFVGLPNGLLMWVLSFAVEDVLLQGLLWYRQSISNQDWGFTK